MIERPFSELQKELEASYQPQFDKAQSEEQHGKVLLKFVLERERLRNGISEPGPDRDRCDRETLKRLANPDALGPEHSMREAVFRRLARDPAEGVAYFDLAKAQTSAQQSARAKKPRLASRDSITRAIEEILEESPHMTASEIGRALKAYDGIIFVDGEYRHTFDASVMRESSLRSRVSDAKKRSAG